MLPGHDCASCDEAPTCKMKAMGEDMIRRYNDNQFAAFTHLKELLDGPEGADAFVAIGALCVRLMNDDRLHDLEALTTSLMSYARTQSQGKTTQMQNLLNSIYSMQVSDLLGEVHSHVGQLRKAMRASTQPLPPPPQYGHSFDLSEMPTMGGLQ